MNELELDDPLVALWTTIADCELDAAAGFRARFQSIGLERWNQGSERNLVVRKTLWFLWKAFAS